MQQALNKHKNYVLNLLSKREYSRFELERKLRFRGLDSEAINSLFDYLDEYQFQSDVRTAEMLVNGHASKLNGRNKIMQAAFAKGLDSQLIEQVIEQQAIDFDQLAKACYQKRYTNTSEAVDWPEKQKRIKYLLSRGFSYDEAIGVLK